MAGTLPLDELLRTSDVVSVHVVLTKETRNMIGARELALMKPVRHPGQHLARRRHRRGGARGGASTPATWRGAALDVFQQEPINMDNPLLACDPDRVILTPHSIGHNLETGRTGVQMALETIERALRGELPESVIRTRR